MAKKSTKLPVADNDYPTVTSNRHTKDDEARERRYKAEDALRDIERAEGHKKDGALMRDVKALSKEKIKILGKVCGK